MVRGLIGALRILWHHATCRYAPLATVTHTSAGRIYECPCGHGIWEVFKCDDR